MSWRRMLVAFAFIVIVGVVLWLTGDDSPL
jgi:hypothetical protein